MYELTCPSCRAVRTSPFVRVNAVTRCPACGHVGRISPGHFQRVPPPGAATAASAAGGPGPDPDPPADPIIDADTDAEPPLSEDPPAADPLGGSSVTGLSGLTEIMQSEPGGPAAAVRQTMPPLQEAQLRDDQAPASRPVSPKARRLALLILGVLALIIAVAGLLVVLVADSPRAEADPPSPRPASETPATEPRDRAAPGPADRR